MAAITPTVKLTLSGKMQPVTVNDYYAGERFIVDVVTGDFADPIDPLVMVIAASRGAGAEEAIDKQTAVSIEEGKRRWDFPASTFSAFEEGSTFYFDVFLYEGTDLTREPVVRFQGSTTKKVTINPGPPPSGGAAITADTAPQLAAADDSDTPADVFTGGAYSSTAGTIDSVVTTYLVNGSAEASSYDLAAGDTLQVRQAVADSAGNSRTFSTGEVTVTLSEAPNLIQTQSLSTLDYGDGANFTLAEPRPAFQYADGGWGVLSSDDVVLANDAPASVADSDGFVMNGGMASPPLYSYADQVGYVNNGTGEQGFEEVLNAPSGDLTNSTFTLPYLPNLNTAPSFTSSAVTLATTGGHGRYVKTVRENPLPLEGGKYQISDMLEKVMLLSVVPMVPSVGSVRPPIIGEYGSILNIADADFGRVRDFALATMPNTLEACTEYMRTQQITTIGEGETRRSLTVGDQNYARDIIRNYVAPAALYMMHSSTSQTDREAILAGFMARAGDAYATYEAGQVTVGGAGQTIVDHFCLAVVAALCPQKTALVSACRAIRSNMNDQVRWAIAEDVGGSDIEYQTRTTGSGSKHNQQPMLPEHVGFPYWTSQSVTLEPHGTGNSLPTARYHGISTGMSTLGAAVLGLIEGGWEAVWGDRATWNANNHPYATLAHADQMRPLTGTAILDFSANLTPSYALAIWDAERATMPHGGTPEPILPTPPVQLSVDMVAEGMLTATSDGADINYAALSNDGSEFTGSNQPITAREWRMSHDGVQWSAAQTKAASDTLAFSGSMYLSERRINASGACPWSPNFPLWDGLDQPERNVVNGAAIPAGSPVMIEAPKLFQYRYDDAIRFPLYDEITGTMGVSKTVLVAGSGLWENGVDDINYQWQSRENGGATSDIVGATGQVWERSLISSPTTTIEVRCKVTTSDGQGNTSTEVSDWLVLPLPPTVTEDYASDIANVTAYDGATVDYQPTEESYRVASSSNAEGYCGAAFEINDLVAGVEYEVSLECSEVNVGYKGSLRLSTTPDNSGELDGDVLFSTAGVKTNTFVAPVDGRIYVLVRIAGSQGAQYYVDVGSVTVEPAQ